jgi:bifunctional oligoribonuclease and PAP phosphatase NrnA
VTHGPTPAAGSTGNAGPIAEADWTRAAKILASAGHERAGLEGADQICLACHVRPDADALGSMLGLALALTAQGRQVIASFGDAPFEVPAILRFLPGLDLLSPPAEVPERPQVMVTLDVASIDRLGALAPAASDAAELIVVDHHASNRGFGTVNLVDPAAAATAVLACELIDQLGIPLTPDIALCLYAGLVTDTGSFKFSATTPEVHELAARLLRAGVDPALVSRRLYDTAPFGYLGMLARALDRAQLDTEACGGLGLVWTTVTRADRGSLPMDAAESVIDEVRKTAEAEVAVVLKEDDHGTWQVSVRSKEVIDVARAAAALGGGGHARAAGFSASGRPDAAVSALKALLDRE